MQRFVDIILVVNIGHDNSNNLNYNNIDSENNLNEFLKQNLMKKKPQGISFSCNFKKVSAFGNILKSIKNKTIKRTVGLRNPYDIKIDNYLQLIFIADYGNYRIIVFNLKGQYLYYFNTPQQVKPEFLYVDQLEDRLLISCNNSIYCCNKKGDNFIEIYSKERISAFTMDSFTKYIYVAHYRSNKIIVIDLNGNLQFEIKGNNLENGAFYTPHGLTFNSKRELLVSDTKNNRIQIFNCNGKFIKSINGGQFKNNSGISVDLINDNILIIDFLNAEIHVLDYNNGKIIETHTEFELISPVRLDYCSVNGCVYICCETSNNVVIFK